MYSTTSTFLHAALITLGLVVASSAAASNYSSSSPIFSTTSSSSRVDRILSADEMLYLGSEGRVEVIARKDYMKYTGGIPIARAEQRYVNFTVDAEENTTIDHKIEKRCTKQTVFSINSIESSINWDVALSGVVRAPPHSSASINVGAGYWIGNSLSVSSSGAFDVVADYLSATLGISYGRTWTTTYSAGYTFIIPPGKYGAIVSNPVVTRHEGHMDVGCIGDSKRTEFRAESYQSKTYSSMSWVEGVIGLCLGDTYPLPRCFGNGTL